MEAHATTAPGGIDTPQGTITLPFSIQDNTEMTLGESRLGIGVGTTTPMDLTVSGVVGIGTTAPNASLQIIGLSTPVNSTSGRPLFLGSSTSSASLSFGYDTSANDTWIQSWNGSPLLLNPAGNNVGIGTTNPSGRIDSETGGANLWAGMFNYNGGSPEGCCGVWTYGSSYALYASGPVYASAYYHTSDARLKTNIRPVDHALDKLLELKGVQFNWRKDGRPDMGVVAQNVVRVFPNAVSKNPDGTVAVDYDSLIAPTIEAIRQLKADNDDLHAELKAANDNEAADTKAVKELRREFEAHRKAHP